MTLRNILSDNTQPCSGCGGCAAACPKGAIRLELDDAGFYQARVSKDLCVDCGLCLKVCSRFTSQDGGSSLYDAELYAMQSVDSNTVHRCSSGGIAHELAIQVIGRGGMAAGAVYDLTTNTVRHEIAAEEEKVTLLDGSKYLQSRTDEAFRDILVCAKERLCAVFGTPCQIAALAAAAKLQGVRDNLLLVEIFCHGVPSYKVWEESLKNVKKKLGTDLFDSVLFRYKKDDWHSYCLKIEGNGSTYYGKRETDLFWQVFFENVLLSDACQICQSRKEKTYADLRLGDYWGERFQHRSDGVSAVFACTPKGMEAVRALLTDGKVVKLEASDAAEMLAAQNMDGYHQLQLHNEAMTLLCSAGVKKAVAYYRGHQSVRQKIKRILLQTSAILPDSLRAKLRKANSSRMLRKS